jgi:hypothetical protein
MPKAPNDNPNYPSLWKAIADHERLRAPDRCAVQRGRVASRQFAGGFMLAPANDNQDWPLLKALRADGKLELVGAAERYRRLWDTASNVPLGTGQPNDLYVVPRYAKKDDPDNRTRGTLETAHAGGDFAGRKVLRETGKIAEKRIEEDARNPEQHATARVRTFKGENGLVAIIDARCDMERLHGVLGPLVDAFEEAVIHSATLAEIGAARGIGQHASGAGKMVVMMGLYAVQAEFMAMDRERRRVA